VWATRAITKRGVSVWLGTPQNPSHMYKLGRGCDPQNSSREDRGTKVFREQQSRGRKRKYIAIGGDLPSREGAPFTYQVWNRGFGRFKKSLGGGGAGKKKKGKRT